MYLASFTDVLNFVFLRQDNLSLINDYNEIIYVYSH